MDKTDEDRLDSFLSLLFGIDSGAMVYLLITHYNPGGIELPTKLPFIIPPAHNELSFGWQVSVLAVCAAVILIIRTIGLWKHQSQRYQKNVRNMAVLLLAATLIATGTAGYKIVKDPGLLQAGGQTP
jgi:hypothetical protein